MSTRNKRKIRYIMRPWLGMVVGIKNRSKRQISSECSGGCQKKIEQYKQLNAELCQNEDERREALRQLDGYKTMLDKLNVKFSQGLPRVEYIKKAFQTSFDQLLEIENIFSFFSDYEQLHKYVNGEQTFQINLPPEPDEPPKSPLVKQRHQKEHRRFNDNEDMVTISEKDDEIMEVDEEEQEEISPIVMRRSRSHSARTSNSDKIQIPRIVLEDPSDANDTFEQSEDVQIVEEPASPTITVTPLTMSRRSSKGRSKVSSTNFTNVSMEIDESMPERPQPSCSTSKRRKSRRSTFDLTTGSFMKSCEALAGMADPSVFAETTVAQATTIDDSTHVPVVPDERSPTNINVALSVRRALQEAQEKRTQKASRRSERPPCLSVENSPATTSSSVTIMNDNSPDTNPTQVTSTPAHALCRKRKQQLSPLRLSVIAPKRRPSETYIVNETVKDTIQVIGGEDDLSSNVSPSVAVCTRRRKAFFLSPEPQAAESPEFTEPSPIAPKMRAQMSHRMSILRSTNQPSNSHRKSVTFDASIAAQDSDQATAHGSKRVGKQRRNIATREPQKSIDSPMVRTHRESLRESETNDEKGKPSTKRKTARRVLANEVKPDEQAGACDALNQPTSSQKSRHRSEKLTVNNEKKRCPKRSNSDSANEKSTVKNSRVPSTSAANTTDSSRNDSTTLRDKSAAAEADTGRRSRRATSTNISYALPPLNIKLRRP